MGIVGGSNGNFERTRNLCAFALSCMCCNQIMPSGIPIKMHIHFNFKIYQTVIAKKYKKLFGNIDFRFLGNLILKGKQQQVYFFQKNHF